MLGKIEHKYDLTRARITAFDTFFNPFKANFPHIKIAIVGSIRRESPEVGDIDIIIASKKYEISTWCYNHLTNPSQKLFENPYQINGFLEEIPTQIWFCDEDYWGPTLLLRTGPREFNMTLASVARKKALHFSEKGLCKRNNNDTPGDRIDNNTESDIINIVLGCGWIPPKSRHGFTEKITSCAKCGIKFIKGEEIIRDDNKEWIHSSCLKVNK